MILWLFALCLLPLLAMIGYYQGAIRVAFSLVGLLLGAVVAIPLAVVAKPILALFTVKHPILLMFFAPVLIFVVILAIFKGAAFALNQKVETHYKYKRSDTERAMWERINQRLGLCLGMVNAAVYLFLLSIVVYVPGYFTFQMSRPEGDSATLRIVNKINEDLAATRMDKAVAPFIPASELYYDSADIMGDVFQNPLLQSRLSGYPVFLTLAERSEFQALANDVAFQEFWLKQPSLAQFTEHAKIKPVLANPALFAEILSLMGGDLKDLKGFVQTGQSARFDHETILGRWTFDFRGSVALTRRTKPGMTIVEVNRIRKVLSTTMQQAMFMATVDNRAILRTTAANNAVQEVQGTWKNASPGKYVLSLTEDGKTLELQASVDPNKLVFTKSGFALVFEK